MHVNASWTARRWPKPGAARRLFALPYAGGGTGWLLPWSAALAADVELVPVCLPGREHRILEDAVPAMDELVPPLLAGLEPHLDRPFALFGHSMGGLIAFEVARQLCLRGTPPSQVLLSACSPIPDPHERPWLTLPEDDLEAALVELDGTPPEALADPELRALVLPTIRADLALADSYRVPAGAQLPVPVTAFAGRGDRVTPPEAVGAWERHAGAGFTLHVLPGGHFFVHDPGTAGVLASSVRALS